MHSLAMNWTDQKSLMRFDFSDVESSGSTTWWLVSEPVN